MLRHRQLILLLFAISLIIPACRSDSAADANVKNVYVAPTAVDCVGAGPQQCYLVAEELNGNWELLYQDINGFGYQPGFFYQLQIREEEVENPPADGTTVRWIWEDTLLVDPAVIKTVVIGPERVECAISTTGFCYEYQLDAGGQWQIFPNEIQGFTYEPGYYYELTVADRQPADGSGPVWTAMQVLNRSANLPVAPTPAAPAATTAVPGTSLPELTTLTFKPITILDLGLRTVVPEAWSAVGSDSRAWAGNSANFVNFTLTPGSEARTALAQMAAAANPESPNAQIFDAQVNGRSWSIYTRTDATQTISVAATHTDGNIHIISLFADPVQTDAILQAILENFEVGQINPE